MKFFGRKNWGLMALVAVVVGFVTVNAVTSTSTMINIIVLGAITVLTFYIAASNRSLADSAAMTAKQEELKRALLESILRRRKPK